MTDNDDITSLEKGAALIKRFAKTLPDTPGVYRMIGRDGKALYVGKAKALKKRVLNYTSAGRLPERLQRMVALTEDMVFVHTHTEVEALLLEANLIKKLKPRYNVLLRDDKSFPYILITGDHDFPLVTKHRGAQKRKGEYFGPFASTGAVNKTVTILQKAFMLRNCSDNVFAQRARPCLQYHIKRCTAPCVDLVSKDDYARQVQDAADFLSGRSKDIQKKLAVEMQGVSDNMDYEQAALLRDRIAALTAIQSQQDVNLQVVGDADVMGLYRDGHKSCIQMFFFRGGQNFGSRSYFPRHSDNDSDEEILEAFLAQFYESKPVPQELIISHKLPQAHIDLLKEALETQAERKITITVPQKGVKRRLIGVALDNAHKAWMQDAAKSASQKANLEGLAKICRIQGAPERIEIYDNSHISGTNMVGGMVVAGPEGFQKNAYRKFNIKKAKAADDYGMMREVMERRFLRTLKEEKVEGGIRVDWPDLLLIDGGKGQLSSVYEVLEDLGIAEDVAVLAIAKGPDRNAGREELIMRGRESFTLPPNDPVLHYLQRLRDEAHRFAIGAHRARRKADISKSILDDVPGIGAKRKKALLHHFGSAQAVAQAGVMDLIKVDGVSKLLAQDIYDYFHES